MKGNKIIATLVVLAMLLSTMVVLNQLNVIKQASAQPGVDEWGFATEELVYGESYAKNTIELNTTTWAAGVYYLYYPTYRCSTGAGRPAVDFDWTGIFLNDQGDQVFIDATGDDADVLDTNNRAITFNRSGMWIFDDEHESELVYKYPYFQGKDPIHFKSEYTYTDQYVDIKNVDTFEWQHTFGDIITALINEGLKIVSVKEYPYTLFPQFPFLEEVDKGLWKFKNNKYSVPMIFSIKAIKE